MIVVPGHLFTLSIRVDCPKLTTVREKITSYVCPCLALQRFACPFVTVCLDDEYLIHRAHVHIKLL